VWVWMWECVWMWLSNQSAKWPILVQIFLFFERKTHMADARAYA
jgi:hypothetical protein